MTPNPNENQAEKHSPTPWITGTMLKHVVYDANATIACDCGHRSNAEFSEANAARIVAAVNYCAGVPTLMLNIHSSPTPLADHFADSAKQDLLISKLTAELSTLRKELEDEQGRWQESIYNLCLKHAPDNKIDGAGCDSGDPLDFTLTEISQAFAHLTEQLEAAKKAQEWIESHKATLLKALTDERDCGKLFDHFKNTARHGLEKVLNNGKDGK